MGETAAVDFERRTGGAEWVPYWAAGRRRELRFQRCGECAQWRFPPGPLCPACLSDAASWELASGRATLLSWVVVHPPVLPAWQDRVPYVVVLVQTEEGLRTMGNLLDATADDLVMDMPMRVDFAPSVDGDLVPQWRIA